MQKFLRNYNSSSINWSDNVWDDINGSTVLGPGSGDEAILGSTSNTYLNTTLTVANSDAICDTLTVNDAYDSLIFNNNINNYSIYLNKVNITGQTVLFTNNVPVIFNNTLTYLWNDCYFNNVIFSKAVTFNTNSTLNIKQTSSSGSLYLNAGINAITTVDITTAGASSGYTANKVFVAGNNQFRNLSVTGLNWVASSSTAFGNGTVTVNGGAISASTSIVNTRNNPLNINGDLFYSPTGAFTLTFGTGLVSITNNPTINIQAGNLTLGGVVSSSSAFSVKSGLVTYGGSLTLSGNNTAYSGNINVTNFGWLRAGSSSAFGSGLVTINTGRIGAASALSLSNNFSIGGVGFDAGSDLTLSGVITLNQPSLIISVPGTGNATLTISGVIAPAPGTTYGLTIDGSKVSLTNTSNLHRNTSVFNGGMLTINGNVLGSIDPANGFANTYVSGSTLAVKGNVSLSSTNRLYFQSNACSLTIVDSNGSLTLGGETQVSTPLNLINGSASSVVDFGSSLSAIPNTWTALISVYVGEAKIGATINASGDVDVRSGASLLLYNDAYMSSQSIFIGSANTTGGRNYSLRLVAGSGPTTKNLYTVNVLASGALISNSGTNILTTSTPISSSTFGLNIASDANSELRFNSSITGSGNITYNNDNQLGTISLYGNAENSSYSGISYLYGITKVSKFANAGSNSCLGTGVASGNPNSIIYLGFGETYENTLEFTGTNSSTNRPFYIGSNVIFNSGSGDLTLNGNISPPSFSNHEIKFNGTNVGRINGIISNSVGGTTGIRKSGSGEWYVSGVNTYLGSISVTEGILRLTTATSVGDSSSTNPISVTGGTLLLTNNSYNFNSRIISLAGTGTTSYLGSLTANATSDLTVQPAINLTADANIQNISSSNLMLSSSTLNLSTFILKVYGSGPIYCSKVITGTSGVIAKYSSGPLTLESISSSNNYGDQGIIIYDGDCILKSENPNLYTPISGDVTMWSNGNTKTLKTPIGTTQKGSILIPGDLRAFHGNFYIGS